MNKMAYLPLISTGISNSLWCSKSSKNISPNQLWNNKTHHSLISNLDIHNNHRCHPKHRPKFHEILSRGRGWRARGIDDGSCGIPPYVPPPPPSASDVARKFYEAINTRDDERLNELLSDNCHYEDLIFYIPFQGKEVIKYKMLST